MKYLKMLVEDFHSTTVATIGDDGYPQTRVIDFMHYDEQGLYFLTAKGKKFYEQLIKQLFIAVSATKDKKAISIRGKVKNIGTEMLDIMFEKNPYMYEIYPEGTRDNLVAFCLYDGIGEFYDISVPSKIFRDTITIGQQKEIQSGYYINKNCIGCKKCYSICPQKCIDISKIPVEINQNNCLRCGNCQDICPQNAIDKRG